MWGIRLIVSIMLFLNAPAFSKEYDVHDILYRSLVGDNVKGKYMGKIYNDQPEMLDDDLYILTSAVISYRSNPLNVNDGSWPIPLNYDHIEVEFEVIGKYSGASKKLSMTKIKYTRHLKYDYHKKTITSLSAEEPQFVACSIFIDHVYNLQKELANAGVVNHEDSHPNKILFKNLNELIDSIDSDVKEPFCSKGFSLVIERTPRKPNQTETLDRH